MSETTLRIEWPHQAIDVDDITRNAIIVRNLLTVYFKILGYAPLCEDRRKRHEPQNFQDFWFMLQDIIENEYNIQLSKICEQTL